MTFRQNGYLLQRLGIGLDGVRLQGQPAWPSSHPTVPFRGRPRRKTLDILEHDDVLARLETTTPPVANNEAMDVARNRPRLLPYEIREDTRVILDRFRLAP